MKFLIIISFVFICSSCTQQKTPLTPVAIPDDLLQTYWQSPIPTPAFITGVSKEAKQGEQICIGILDSIFWQPGESANDVYRKIVAHSSMAVDWWLVAEFQYMSLANLIERFDNQGNKIGSYGGGTSICFTTNNMVKGYHLANYVFELGNLRYSYSWVFYLE